MRAWGHIAAGVAVGVLLGAGLLLLVGQFAQTIELLLAAVIIGDALSPLVGWLARRLPRGAAIAAVYIALLLILAGVGMLVVPVVIAQIQQIVSNAPQWLSQFKGWASHFGFLGSQNVQNAIVSGLSKFSDTLLSLPLTLSGYAADGIAVFFMSVYWLFEAPALKRFTLSLVPEGERDHADAVLGEMGRSMGGYIRGVVLDGLVIGVLDYIGLVIIGVKYALVLALISFFAELIPVLGPILASIPALIVALLTSPVQFVIVLVFKLLLHQTEGHLVAPNIMRSQTDVPQLLVLVALFAGAGVAGMLGALIAIPIAGALRVLLLRVVAPAVRHRFGVPEPAPEEPPPRGARGAPRRALVALWDRARGAIRTVTGRRDKS
ncbi:MAG TPA: AI-2E family transporter [Thermomicrobiales bacterium]|nr:AI-2E family transporter [Thermomicrobiales bacterium]